MSLRPNEADEGEAGKAASPILLSLRAGGEAGWRAEDTSAAKLPFRSKERESDFGFLQPETGEAGSEPAGEPPLPVVFPADDGAAAASFPPTEA